MITGLMCELLWSDPQDQIGRGNDNSNLLLLLQ